MERTSGAGADTPVDSRLREQLAAMRIRRSHDLLSLLAEQEAQGHAGCRLGARDV